MISCGKLMQSTGAMLLTTTSVGVACVVLVKSKKSKTSTFSVLFDFGIGPPPLFAHILWLYSLVTLVGGLSR